jgi:apolipoprotein N-acyltransferase
MERQVQSDSVVFRWRVFLCILSGAMMGASFPPSPYGVLAWFSLVPFLVVLFDTERTRSALGYTYLTLLVFHVLTLNWTGGYAHGNDPYMMIAGGVTMVFHPLFYLVPVSLFLFIRRRLGNGIALASFPLLWVSYEYSHSLSEWSFPWLTLGHSQSYDLERIQFAEYTGVWGVSLWILVINVLAFLLYSGIARRSWNIISRQSAVLLMGIILLAMLPRLHGSLVLSQAPKSEAGGMASGERMVRVGIIQPNIDPWLKWKADGVAITKTYLQMTDSLVAREAEKPDIVLWPETALPYRILAPSFRSSLHTIRQRLERLGVSVVTGFPHQEVYADSGAAPPSAKRSRVTGMRYDDFNAAAFLRPGEDEIPWYGKMKMVPLAERIPYADAFYWLDVLRWGVGIGGWQIGRDSTIFQDPATGARFCTMICYESVYPAFVASFVRQGAEFITIITIDSWWGRMSGAFQHHRFAVFRAIENRHWIARCAVGGISGYIDPYGRYYDTTELFTRTSMSRAIARSDERSMYTTHGDWLPQVCVCMAGMLVAASFGQTFRQRIRKLQWEGP